MSIFCTWAFSYKHKFSGLKIFLGKRNIFQENQKILNHQFFLGNQKNFWQDFLVQLAGQIPEKIARNFL